MDLGYLWLGACVTWTLTSLVPRNELTDVMMWRGWILLDFQSAFRMSVRSKILWRLELNILWERETLSETCVCVCIREREWDIMFVCVYVPWPHQPVWSVWVGVASCTQTSPFSSNILVPSQTASLSAPWSTWNTHSFGTKHSTRVKGKELWFWTNG